MAELVGYSITVVSDNESKIIEAHKKAKDIFHSISDIEVVTPIMDGANRMKSFFIAPYFSKPSFDLREKSNKARSEFIDWMVGVDHFSEFRDIWLFETGIDLDNDRFKVLNTLDNTVVGY